MSMIPIGGSHLRSTAVTFGRIAALVEELSEAPHDDRWLGPAAFRYRGVATAVAHRTTAVAGEVAAVPGLLMTLAETVDFARDEATRRDATVEAARRRWAQAEATGDPLSITVYEDELAEVTWAADRAVERAIGAVQALDRRVASAVDDLLVAGSSIELGSLLGAADALMTGDPFQRELEMLGATARLRMAEHAGGSLTQEIERLELTMAYLRMLGLTGVDLGLLEELRRHRTRLLAWAASERQFLAYDPSDGSRVVEVFGDLVRADHVAVVVPGITNSEFNYHRVLEGVARSLQNGDRSVAVIAWLGYDTPGAGPMGTGMLTFDAVGTDLAAAGAAELASFVEWLVARREDAHISVVAHSYGTVVAGMASADGALPVDDLVLVGSPGVPVDDRADLHLRPGGVVWAGLAPWDPIDELADIAAPGAALIHGTNPVDGAFGAVELPFEDSYGHSGYFDAAGISVLFGVITGRDDVGKRRDNDPSAAGGGAW